MSFKLRAFRGSLLLTFGEAAIYGCSFVRNMVLARILTKADFGIAATFSLIVTLLEMSDKLGMARFVVRDQEGNEPHFIATAHLMHFVVATFSAIAIATLAVPLSLLFRIGEHRWAIALLAVAPLCRGLEHLDIRRYERSLRFVPSLLVELIPQVAITLLAWPAARMLPGYHAVLALLLTKALISCIASHMLAERRYTWCVNRMYMTRMMRFGWPLLVNGFLLFGVLQGDQFLIGARYNMGDLGEYAAASALTMAPTFFFARVFNSVSLPILASVQDDPRAFTKRYRQIVAVIGLFASTCAVGTILGGEALMRVTYGAKYAGAGILVACLSAANAFRNIRLAPALAALAKGDSHNHMIQNWWRVMSLIPAAALALAHQPLWSIACCGIAAEAPACWVSFRRLKRRDGVPLSSSLAPVGCTLLSLGAAAALVYLGFYRLSPLSALFFTTISCCFAAIVLTAVSPELREETYSLYMGFRRLAIRFMKTPATALPR